MVILGDKPVSTVVIKSSLSSELQRVVLHLWNAQAQIKFFQGQVPISAVIELSYIFTRKGTIDLCKYCFNRELLMLLIAVKGTVALACFCVVLPCARLETAELGQGPA